MSICEFKYSIGQRVRIVDIDIVGVVLRRCDRGPDEQQTFEAVFWADTTRRLEWVLAHELVAA